MTKILPTLRAQMQKMQAHNKIKIVIFIDILNPDVPQEIVEIFNPKNRKTPRRDAIIEHKQLIEYLVSPIIQKIMATGAEILKIIYLQPMIVCYATKEQIEKIALAQEVVWIFDDDFFD